MLESHSNKQTVKSLVCLCVGVGVLLLLLLLHIPGNTFLVITDRLTLRLCVRLYEKAIYVENVRDNVHQYGVLPALPSHSFLLISMLSVQGSLCLCGTPEMDV
jgi:hypothetical protein